MYDIAKQLLAEKLLDNYYETNVVSKRSHISGNLLDQLKELLPSNKHELLEQWESLSAERCGEELLQFAFFVAEIFMSV